MFRFLVFLSAASYAAGQSNLAYDKPAPTVPPRLTEQSRKMEQRVYRVTDNVYSAVGFGLANSTMVIGNDGVIIIDTLESLTSARNVAAAFRAITTKPVKAVVYTHNHTDHILGIKAFVKEEDVRSGAVAVYAHSTMMQTVISNASIIGPILTVRSAYSLGLLLPLGPEGLVNDGLGPRLIQGEASFIAPTKTFDDTLDVEIAGVKMHLAYAPSETDDEIVAWFPDWRLLQSAEVIQGETFPNVHTLRGTKYRDPVKWFKSIDKLRAFHPDYLVPSHGRPMTGASQIEEMLTAYRDAIQYVHDQTIRNMNRGLTPDELVEVVSKLPPHLASNPWLGEFYGTVKHSVREIYQGYLGWFQGDPTLLDPLPPLERAERYVRMMGGRDAVLKEARASDHKWAAELLTYLIRINKNDTEARTLKAQALSQLAFQTENINWRNWYLTSALELEGRVPNLSGNRLAAPDILKEMPLCNYVEGMTVLLDPIKSADAHVTVAFRLSDKGQSCALEVRRGIAQLHDPAPNTGASMVLTSAQLFGALSGTSTLAQLVTTPGVVADADRSTVAQFFSYFDPPAKDAVALTVR
jgi:alkyl sulfatase BDS1-like metallo-beta-lactamase superfamily hydrolase